MKANEIISTIANAFPKHELGKSVPLQTAPVPEVQPEITAKVLPEGLVFCVIDDDLPVRMASKGLLRKAKAHQDSVILGETHDDAVGFPDTVRELAKKHGESNIVVITDQNLEAYKEGPVFGTKIVEALGGSKFPGLLCIRSASSLDEYFEA